MINTEPAQRDALDVHDLRVSDLEDRVKALEDKIEAKQSAVVPLNELGKRVFDLEARIEAARANPPEKNP